MVLNKNAVRSIDVPSGDAVIDARVAGDGPAVVMLAGHSRGVSDLAELMEALAAAGHQVVGINIRGAEGSSGPVIGAAGGAASSTLPPGWSKLPVSA